MYCIVHTVATLMFQAAVSSVIVLMQSLWQLYLVLWSNSVIMSHDSYRIIHQSRLFYAVFLAYMFHCNLWHPAVEVGSKFSRRRNPKISSNGFCVTLRRPSLDSERGRTGEFWSKTNLIKWQNSEGKICLCPNKNP